MNDVTGEKKIIYEIDTYGERQYQITSINVHHYSYKDIVHVPFPILFLFKEIINSCNFYPKILNEAD
jgi:lipopolysaccharide export system protein LptC